MRVLQCLRRATRSGGASDPPGDPGDGDGDEDSVTDCEGLLDKTRTP